jgi:hypothetical protein
VDALDKLNNICLLNKFSRIHPRRCIGFIEEEAKTADTTPNGSTI